MAKGRREGKCPKHACDGDLATIEGRALRCRKCGETFTNARAVALARAQERLKEVEEQLRRAGRELRGER